MRLIFPETNLGRPSSSHVQRTTANTDTRYAATLDSLSTSNSSRYQSARPSAVSPALRPQPGDRQGGARPRNHQGRLPAALAVARLSASRDEQAPWALMSARQAHGVRRGCERRFAHLRGPLAEGL
jgi:hypothetical protein